MKLKTELNGKNYLKNSLNHWHDSDVRSLDHGRLCALSYTVLVASTSELRLISFDSRVLTYYRVFLP